MNSRISFPVLAALALLLAACTTTSVPEPIKAKIKRVAIVSLFPAEVDIHQIGVVPILHESRIEQIQEWNAYTATVAVATRLLRERGYEVVTLDARESLTALPEIPEPASAVARFLPSARAQMADAIVVVSPDRMSSNGPTFYSVYFASSKLFAIKSVWGGCASSVHVYSTDSCELLAKSTDNKSFQEMPGVPWRGAWFEYSAAERRNIYSLLEKIVEENLQWKISRVL